MDFKQAYQWLFKGAVRFEEKGKALSLNSPEITLYGNFFANFKWYQSTTKMGLGEQQKP